MIEKQPIYIFEEMTSTGIYNIPLGSTVSVNSNGTLFTLTTKVGLIPTSTVADAILIPQNKEFQTDVTGPSGPQGQQGPQGIKGDTGSTGNQGVEGPQGNKGDAGAGVQVYGSDTITNIRGKANIDGHMWISTDSGVDDLGNAVTTGDGVVSAGPSWMGVGPVKGPQGQQGPQGAAGADGSDGAQGIQGADGSQGIQGLKGDDGLTGATGQTGPIGPDGRSAYQVAVDDTGFVGDEAAWMASLVGSQGPIGQTGADSTVQGPRGPDGAMGPIGATGPKGDIGPKGAKGLDATVEFASQLETDAGIIDNKAISPKTLGAAGTMPREDGNEFMTVSNNGVRKDSYWMPFVSSPNVVAVDFTLGVGQNASVVSPTINDGVTITIPDGSSLVIL